MSTELMPFNYEGATVRTVVVDGEAEFVAADVCRVLDHSNPSAAVAGLDEDERGLRIVETPSGAQQMVTVTEAGLYTLIIRSRKSEAKRFRRWVTHEVLPSIRRAGSYAASAALPDRKALARMVIESEEARELAEARVAELEPKAEAFDELMDANGCYSMNAAAKILGWGRNVMFRELRRLGILQANNLPYQRYEHHFKVVPGTYYNPKTEQTVPTATPFVRPSGLEYLRKRLATVTV